MNLVCNKYSFCVFEFFKYEMTIHTLRHCKNVLGLFPCVQVTSHLKYIRVDSVGSSLPCINIGVRIN